MRISDWSSDVCSSDLADVLTRMREDPRKMARRRGARGAFLPRRRRRFHTRGARGRRQGHRLRSRDLAAPDGARDARRTIVARDEHRRGPPLSPRRAAMRRALAALATIVVFTGGALALAQSDIFRSEKHTSELQSLMRISYAVFCLKKKKINIKREITRSHTKQHT